MDATGEGLWDWDLRNNRVTHNRRWLQLLGVDDHYREHDFETFAVLLHPDDRPAVEAAVEASVANDETFSHEHRMVRPDGEVIWVLDRGKVVERDADGQPLRMVGSLLDITDRRQATEQLRVRELYLRATLDNLPFLFWLKDTESRFLTVNRQFAMACGRGEPERVVGLTDLDVWPRDLAEAYRADDREVMAERQEKAVEEPVETEGERRWIETYKKPVVAEDGTLFGTVGFARDITERKEMEHELAQSQQRWHLAVSGTKDGIWDWNVATGKMYFSPRWKEMLGFREDELDDRFAVWESLIHPDDLPGVRAALERHLRGETEYFQAEFRMHTRDGADLWILSRGRALFDQAGAPIRMSGSHTDISDRRLAEAAIRERTEQLDAIFSLSPDGFVAFDAKRRVRYVNPAFVHMTGFAEAEVTGMGEADFSAALIENVRPSIEFTGIDALRADAAERGGISRAVLLELQRAPRTVLQMGLGVSHSETVSQILYFRDVTRETEVDRMKSEFLSTAAHELRTPMASILGFSELLLSDGFDEGTRRELLQTVHTQSELMASILNELLDLARIEARKGKDFVLEPVQLGDLLFEAVASYLAPPGRELPVLEKGDADVTLLADRTKLLQVVGNVLSNAYKYSPEGGEVSVRLLPPRERDGHRTAGFSVTDHGIGMSPEQLARVCERFYRADTSGQIPGTGLGMSIVKEIVELHQGHVEVESSQGQGTTVTVWLKATLD
jgi:PAS domain S-box-containing protein